MSEENETEAVVALSKRIGLLLEEKGLKQSDLAERTGLSRPVVSRLMSGKRKLSAEEVGKVAQALGLTLAEFVAGTDAASLADEQADQIPRADYARMEARLAQVATDLDTLRAEHEALKAVHERLKSEHQDVRLDRDERREEVERLSREKGDLEQEVQELEREKRRFAEELSSALQMKDAAEGERRRLQAELSSQRAQVQSLEASMRDLQKTAQEQQSRLQQKDAELRSRTLELDKANRETSRVTAQLETARGKTAEIAGAAQKVLAKFEEESARSYTLQQQVWNLESALSAANQHYLRTYEAYRQTQLQLQNAQAKVSKKEGETTAAALLGVLGAGLALAAGAAAGSTKGRR